jgi:hypothetical protein
MGKSGLILIVTFIVTLANAQSRIAIDFNSNMINGFLSVHYCPVFKQHYYVKSGLTFGRFGRGEGFQKISQVQAGNPLISYYTEMNEPVFPQRALHEFTSRIKGVALEIGVGRFFELGPVHTIRFDIQSKIYRIREAVIATYASVNPGDSSAMFKGFGFTRFCLSVGPELFHAIRLSARYTFFYGVKLPYYLPLKTKGYRPIGYKNRTVGLQPNLTIGLSYAITQKKIEKKKSD